MKKSSKQTPQILRGIVKKSNKSKGFYVDDLKYDSQYKLGKKELFKAMPGDLVECSLTEKGWAKILKVKEENTKEFIGKIFKRGQRLYTSPLGYEYDLKILIREPLQKTAKDGGIGKFTMHKQPSVDALPEANMTYLFDQDNEFNLAYEMSVTNHQLRREWPKAVINESKQLKEKKFDIDSVVDLRNKTFVTIDGKSAKDFDDAVLGEKDEEGNLILYVAIADVGRYIDKGSCLDQEALERGTSVYFSQRVIPMLPEVLSNDLCSLKPNEDRFCLVCKTTVDSEGNLSGTSFFEAIINSKSRLTYGTVTREVERKQFKKPYDHSLKILLEIYNRLKSNRSQRGSLELDVPTFIPKVENQKISKFVDSPREISHMMIEEFMLAANISAADLCLKFNIPSVFRVHPKPDILKVKILEEFLRSRRINASLGDGSDIKKLTALAHIAKDRKDKNIIHSQILFSMSLATYESEIGGHYALNYDSYSHFTSPIRRYPDLLVHRVIKSLIHANNGAVTIADKKQINNPIYTFDELEALAKDCSTKERVAEKAEREALSHLKCAFAAEHVGETFDGQIIGVTNFGLFILLKGINIEGLCHIKYLPRKEFYVFDEHSKMLQSNSSRHSYSLGDEVKATIDKVEVFSKKIDLRLLK
ncbi:VacB/RNase II family 3'-5' exoribonuclease [Gammaproteobacteria bacterium]|nr:VacB/RNase II family 3'-5' exoribonuclease [Gammaproteobacteria bacterium]